MDNTEEFSIRPILKRTLLITSIISLLITGYYIFVSNNYDLFLTYYIFAFSFIILVGFIPKRIKKDEEYIPLKEKIKKPSTILAIVFLIINLLTTYRSYSLSFSPVILEPGVYIIESENPTYVDYNSDRQKIGNITLDYPRKPLDPQFAQSFLNDLAKLEGESVRFIEGLNWYRISLKEGKPKEIGLHIIVSPNARIGSLHVYPNGMATITATTSGKYRTFKIELSDETIKYFRAMVG